MHTHSVNSHAKCLVFQTFSLFSISKNESHRAFIRPWRACVYSAAYFFFFFFFFFSWLVKLYISLVKKTIRLFIYSSVTFIEPKSENNFGTRRNRIWGFVAEQGNKKARRLSSIVIVTSIVVVVVLPRAPCAQHDPNYRRPLRYEASSAAGPMIFLSPLPHFFFPFCFFLPGRDIMMVIQVMTNSSKQHTHTHTPSLVPLSLSIKRFYTYGYTTPGVRDEGYVTLPPCSFSMSCRPQNMNRKIIIISKQH